MNQTLPLEIPHCFGIHINLNELEKDVYIPVRAAKEKNDEQLGALQKIILKHFPEAEGKMQVINFADFKEDKVFFFDGHFLDHPILIEKKPAVAND